MKKLGNKIKKEITPPGMEFLDQFKDKSPVQIISQLLPKFADALKTDQAQNAIDAFAGLLWGLGLDLGASLPEWVKSASEKFWQFSGMNFLKNLENNKPADFGSLLELINLQPINKNLPPEQAQVIDNIGHLIKSESANLSAVELKQFADARVAAPKIINKLKNPTDRTMIFIIIACAWREIEKLGSHAKTHQWLLDHKIISSNTDRAETAKFFREINLPKGKAGRPKKLRTVK